MPADFVSLPPYNVIQPGAYSAVNASLLTSPNLSVPAPIPAFLGVAYGGAPNTPMYFQSPGQAQQVLQSGPLYDCVRFAFNAGAPQVCAVRVGNSVTQASLALAASAGTGVTLTSIDYGSWTNSILITVATGPIITLTYTNSLGVVYTESWNLTGVGSLTPALIAQAINGQLYGFNASNYVTAAAGSGTLPLTNVSNSPLAGGTDGTSPASGDWTNGLTALQAAPVDMVTPATSSATVHAQVLTHCQTMSAPNARMERVAIVGGASGETVAYQTGTRIPSLQSARAQLIYPGTYDYNAAGQVTLYDPFYSAAKIAGMHAALPDVATALTHNLVPGIDVEVALSTVQGGAIDQLLYAGVTPLARAPRSGVWVVDSLSGYNQPDQTFRDIHKTRSADYVAQYVRHDLESAFVGGKTLTGTANQIQAHAADDLQALQNANIIRAFKNPSISPGPNVNSYVVGLPVMLVDTDKYIFISVNLQPSSTVNTSGGFTNQDSLT